MTQKRNPETREELESWPAGALIPQSEADHLRSIFPPAWDIGMVSRLGNVISFTANDFGPEAFKQGMNAARALGLNSRAPDGDDHTPETVFYTTGNAARGTFKIVLDDGGQNTLAALFTGKTS